MSQSPPAAREQVLQTAFDLAARYEMTNGGCPQTTLSAIFEALDIENDNVFKAATGFADGLGLSGDGHCGALSGGVLAISYCFGREKQDFGDMMKLLPANALSKALHARFVAKYRTCRCADIQTAFLGRFYDLYDPEQMTAAFEAGLLQKCSVVCGETARMATEIILDARERIGPGT